MGKRVLLGMSGGVDSSVSAILLKNAGYEVIGITMELWKEECEKCGGCLASSAALDAKKVCDKLGIEHHVVNFSEAFKNKVVDAFINDYKNSRTPNPCVECNKYIKFGMLYDEALKLNCDYIATGHYAKIEFSKEFNQYVLKKSNALAKDQTYFLYGIPKEVLSHILFPLEELEDKSITRKIAEENGLIVANKPDSQEICFIEDDDYVAFLKRNMNSKIRQGNIVLKDGTVLGKHKGLINYTVGQRKGLGLSYPVPLYVIKLDSKKNQLVVGPQEELYTYELYANDLNMLTSENIEIMDLNARIRYRARDAKAKVKYIDKNTIKITFEEPQRAITPGQSVVLFKDDIVLGGGKIILKDDIKA